MLDRTEFRLKLIKPLMVYVGLSVLLATSTIGIVFWRGAHGRPHWADDIAVWNACANMALIVGWIVYVQLRRAGASRKVASTSSPTHL